MSTSIYYFTATGNSYTTAKMIAEGLGDCRLVPAAATVKLSKVVEEADTVGFVFPVYYGDMPWPVRQMIAKMVFKPDTYIFACATYRGHSGTAYKKLDQMLRTRGQKLSLALGLPMPGNSFINEAHVDAEHLAKQAERVEAIIETISQRPQEDHHTDEVLPLRPVSWPNNFRGIMADENCIGCGVCASVCPMDNIRIVDGHAQIGDDCSTCLACFHWCPKEAIYMSREEKIARRAKYRHPEITIDTIIAQKG